LLSPTQHQLESLQEACQLAARADDHGDAPKEVSACRLDSTAFATQFSLANTGLIDIVGQALFEGMTDRRDIRFELYGLNIYGRWSFAYRADSKLTLLMLRCGQCCQTTQDCHE
jgi:hypothetical protein